MLSFVTLIYNFAIVIHLVPNPPLNPIFKGKLHVKCKQNVENILLITLCHNVFYSNSKGYIIFKIRKMKSI